MIPLVAAIESVAQADLALAAEAAAKGQWAALRAVAAPDAFLDVPTRTPAAPYLARLPEPAPDHVLSWRPTQTITSCDTTLAYVVGPWSRPDGHAGWYGMLWRNMPEGWRWITEIGHDGGPPAPGHGREEDEAACPGPAGSISPPPDQPGAPVETAALTASAYASLTARSDGPMPVSLTLGAADGQGGSADRSLMWRTNPVAGHTGAHLLRLWSWDGRRYRLAVIDYSAGD